MRNDKKMTPEARIDAALDAVLRASGSSLKYYTGPKILKEMRDAMRRVMTASYSAGTNDCFAAMNNPIDAERVERNAK